MVHWLPQLKDANGFHLQRVRGLGAGGAFKGRWEVTEQGIQEELQPSVRGDGAWVGGDRRDVVL